MKKLIYTIYALVLSIGAYGQAKLARDSTAGSNLQPSPAIQWSRNFLYGKPLYYLFDAKSGKTLPVYSAQLANYIFSGKQEAAALYQPMGSYAPATGSSNYVPYMGATSTLDLGFQNLKARTVIASTYGIAFSTSRITRDSLAATNHAQNILITSPMSGFGAGGQQGISLYLGLVTGNRLVTWRDKDITVASTTDPVSTFINDAGYLTGVSIYPSYGFTGSAGGTLTNPILTIRTTVADGQMIRSQGGAIIAATPGTDFVSPAGSYTNPSWITSLPYSKITGAPTNVSSFTNDAGYQSQNDLNKDNVVNSVSGTITFAPGISLYDLIGDVIIPAASNYYSGGKAQRLTFTNHTSTSSQKITFSGALEDGSALDHTLVLPLSSVTIEPNASLQWHIVSRTFPTRSFIIATITDGAIQAGYGLQMTRVATEPTNVVLPVVDGAMVGIPVTINNLSTGTITVSTASNANDLYNLSSTTATNTDVISGLGKVTYTLVAVDTFTYKWVKS